MPNGLIEAAVRRPLLLDAAMGTRLIGRGLDLRSDDPSLWNLSHPDVVLALHRRDVAAGADGLVTNTFGASAAWLDRFGKADLVATIIRRAVELAREAAGPDRFVLGSIGPTAASEPAVRRQVDALAEAGVDAILFETQTEATASIALEAVRSRTPLPLFVTFFRSPTAERWRRSIDSGADAVGMNCASPAECMLGLGAETGSLDVPSIVQPSGGEPGKEAEEPNRWATFVSEALRLGVRFVGGCCGTTEAHVAALRSALDSEVPNAV